MKKSRVVMALAVFLMSAGAFASPVITSVSPTVGPAAGGTEVTIHGSGFSNNCIVCSPPFADPEVFFGDVHAASVTFVDPTTLRAVTPPHLPVTVGITVLQRDGSDPSSFVLPDAFTFTGDIEEAFDPILFPIFKGPVHGRFGSEFVTVARVAAKESPVLLYGQDTSCLILDPPMSPDNPISVGLETTLLPNCNESTGRIFYVERGRSDQLAANLRVADVSQDALEYGTEIPVVRRNDFSESRVVLLGIPIDARFRNTLRIYSLAQGIGYVNVTVGNELLQIPLEPGGDRYTPSYAAFTDFPLPGELQAGQNTITITVEVPRLGVVLPPMPIWAFVSVTNNETNRITTITPN